MPDTPLFAKRYRIPSARMPKWDYAGYGSYFITIKTHERYPWFGHIQNGIMCLSDVGSVVEQYWSAIPDHFPHVYVDTHIVMPDHVHGVITINKRFTNVTDISNDIGIKRLQPGSLGSVINQFKSTCTRHIRDTGHPDFGWQPRFHDHVIRDEWELRRIRNYIINNPAVWQADHPAI